MVLAPAITALLVSSGAFAHGGNPETQDLVPTPSGHTLVTSHGFLEQTDDGYQWVCEEVIGDAYRSGFLVTDSGTWVLATTQGVLVSGDGCDWTWSQGLADNVGRIAVDTTDASVLWASTSDGLWRSDDEGLTFTLDLATDASTRSFVQTLDGAAFYLFAFNGADPEVWIADANGFTATPFNTSSGQLIALATDTLGRAYARFPSGATDELLRFNPDGQVETLLQTDLNISAFHLTDAGDLYVSVRGIGTQRSTDDGLSWLSPVGPALNCLHDLGGTRFACPDVDSGESALYASSTTDILDALATTLLFTEVTGPKICAANSDYARVCEPLWDDVAFQFGLSSSTSTNSADVEVPGRCGCSQSSRDSWVAWFVVLLLLRRRSDGYGAAGSRV